MKALLPLISGIFLYNHLKVDIFYPVIIFIFCFIWVAFRTRKTTGYNLNFYGFFYYGLIFIGLLSIGYMTAYFGDGKIDKNYYGKHIDNTEAIKFRIESIVKKSSEYYTVKGNVEYIFLGKEWIAANGAILCYIEGDSLVKSGNAVISNITPSTFEAPRNPGGFNIKKYYSNKGISYFLYLSQEDYKILKSTDPTFSEYLDRFRWKLRDQLMQSLDDREAGVAIAMILGLKNDLSDELQDTYAKIGIMHILAVSGLHVGILFLVIRFLFGGFRYHYYGKWVFLLVALMSIWSYASLAGLSSSVFRAAIMFSVFIFGEQLNRKNYLLNSTAFAAFFILLITPDALYDIGFQLSFTAVAAIIILYPPLFNAFSIQNNFLKSIWQLMCVSIAAQIGTLPISLLYFHQFAPGFIIANLAAIPLAFAIMSAGFLYVLLFMTIGINGFVTTLLQKLIYIANEIFILLERPFPVIENIQINEWQVILAYLLILFIYAFFAMKRFSRFVLVAACATLLMLVTIGLQYNTLKQRKIIFYSTKYGTVMDQINGQHYREIIFKAIPEESYQYEILPARNYYGLTTRVSNEDVVEANDSLMLAVLNGYSILSIKDQNVQLPGNLNIDLLVLPNGKFNGFWYDYYKDVGKKILIGPDVDVDGSLSSMPHAYKLKNKCLIINGMKQEGTFLSTLSP